MIVTKLMSSQKKRIEQKPAFQRPIYKSYRELLQLDRPKRKISYDSSSSDEDFLEKLLKQQKKKSKSKKKSSRKNTSQNETRPKRETMQLTKVVVKAKKEEEKKKPKVLSQIQMFLAQTKELELPTTSNPQNQKSIECKQKQVRPVKSKSTQRLSPVMSYQKNQKSKSLKKDVLLGNPIFIDTKSIQAPPVLYSSACQMFNTSLASRQSIGYHQLLNQKLSERAKVKKESIANAQVKDQKIEFRVNAKLQEAFTFQPSIDPLYPHWRLSMTLNPLEGRPVRKFKDHDTLFKSEREEQIFVRSLRELAKARQ